MLCFDQFHIYHDRIKGRLKMTKHFCAAVALLTLISGAASAQSMSSETTTSIHSTTTTPPPAVEVVRTTKTEKSVDTNGVETDRGQTFANGPAGTTATATTRTTGPGGEPLSATHQERKVSPGGTTTTTSEATTTTLPR
jgi:hypothetical protein